MYGASGSDVHSFGVYGDADSQEFPTLGAAAGADREHDVGVPRAGSLLRMSTSNSASKMMTAIL
jgi:hypothetical protein